MAFSHPPIILYDFDGVLLNSRAHILAAMELLTDKKHRWNKALVNTTTALDVLRLFESGVRSRSIPTVRAMSRNFVELIPHRLLRYIFLIRYGRKTKKLEWKYSDFLPGADKAIRILSQKGIYQGTVSNSWGYRISRWMQIKGLSEIIQFYASWDDRRTYGSKPKPGPIYAVLLRMKKHFGWGKIDLNRVAFVGDNLTDIMAAKRAKVKSIAVLSGHAYKSEMETMNPDFILDDVTQIPDILPKLFPDD